jgi:CheY-like chemotaxis protein
MFQTLLERAGEMRDPWILPQLDSDTDRAKSILIVEDDPSIRDTLGEVFEGETIHQVLFAEDGEAALEILQTATPQLFLLDYRLPGISGLELAGRIRNMKGYEQTPVVLMSASILREDLTKYQLRYVRKPFDLDQLLQLVEEALAV